MSKTARARKVRSSPGATSSDPSLGPGATITKTWVFSAQFANLERARECVGDAAELCGLDSTAVYATQLAVDEAITNIIEHAYGGESLETIECTCLLQADSLEIQLRDCGNPFDPSMVPEPDLDAELEERDIGGLGLFFIYHLMDEVEFSFDCDAKTGKKCNILRMIKRKEK